MSKFWSSGTSGRFLLSAALALATASYSATRNVSASNVATLQRWVDSADVYPSNHYVIALGSGTYILTKTLKVTKGYVTVNGAADLANAANYVLEGGYPNGGGFKRVLEVQGSSGWTPMVAIRGLTIRGGHAVSGGGGYVSNGYLSLTKSIVRDNVSSSWGSGFFAGSNAQLILSNCIVRGNLNLQAQTNLCGGLTAGGGGVAVNGGLLHSYNTTFMENQACRGAGVAVYNGEMVMESGTISSNNANKRGGGIFLSGSPDVYLWFNTIASNKAGTHSADPSGFYEEKYGGGIAMSGFTGMLEMYGNILAKNQTVFSDKATLGQHGHDCYRRTPSMPTFRHVDNLVGAIGNCTELNSGAPPFQGTEASPVDPLLGPLTLKAGASGNQYTHALLTGSPAVNRYHYNSSWGNYAPKYCPYADQLGHRRDWWFPGQNAPIQCDMGAQVQNWYP